MPDGITQQQLPSSAVDGEILDACCGGRMWWWDKAHPLAVYMDKRTAPKGAANVFDVPGGKRNGSPGWSCEPDIIGDFRDMPFPDESFRLVVFDPPHNVRDEPLGVNGLMYGALPKATEQDDLRRAFAECWRVLRPGGSLVFKWAGKIDRVKPHFPASPIVGTRSPRGLQTWWLVFYKPDDSKRIASIIEDEAESLRDTCREDTGAPCEGCSGCDRMFVRGHMLALLERITP